MEQPTIKSRVEPAVYEGEYVVLKDVAWRKFQRNRPSSGAVRYKQRKGAPDPHEKYPAEETLTYALHGLAQRQFAGFEYDIGKEEDGDGHCIHHDEDGAEHPSKCSILKTGTEMTAHNMT